MATLSKGCSQCVVQTAHGNRGLTGDTLFQDRGLLSSQQIESIPASEGPVRTLVFPNKLMAKLGKSGLSLLLPNCKLARPTLRTLEIDVSGRAVVTGIV